MAVISGKYEKIRYSNLAKVGVEGSNPFARSKQILSDLSDPETWLTERN